ncbi:flagellar hook-associated protein FlgL [Lacunisphaera limnophila]|uniref:Flagellar hook-associated protein FlgL n=1 Tax=Lacunisphaera limnophila TaxID=1838286 RepID=A0A1D8AW73_9BACT|nr:flagellar hook-associated protein FlgL [Lacunisphaera limnophila]AOS45140.1 flagellar hook-associated protein FlgL [Lacunisphaera limnophila]
MRIASNTIQDNIVRQIQSLGVQTAKLQNQVASGQRITQADEDPAAAGRVLNQQSELRRVDQFDRNATRALEISQATFAGLGDVKEISTRAGELATLGRSTAGPDALQAYSAEVNQLIEQLLQVGNTRLGSDYLFAGTAVDTPPFSVTRDGAGNVTAATYDGDNATANIPLSEVASVSPFSSGATNQSVRDLLNQLVGLRDAFNANDSAGIATAQAALINGEDDLVSALANTGAVQMRIEVNRTQQQARGDSLVSLVAGETSADLPDTIVRLNQSQVAYQAALQSAASIMKISLLDYIR